ncbi:homocysteine S-methyltransferase [Actinokineospora bangkokensis]|uniref:Homocysteine S-methyltransferase n=1 Tax=Actinokineospora bangkokensis TaxID=1193682 RepID=A0A1Q9LPE5_9PSEU|nr:homocysteine S-methyltransferase [Actinokineospora bangkokensis]
MVTDGGLATELERRGNDLSDALWSARVLRDDPAEVVAAHESFYRAGAVIATSASYQASYEGFGLPKGKTDALLRRSVALAAEARDLVDDGTQRWIAASVGPYGAALADGSEYRGRYGLTVRELADWHAPRLAVLADAGADVLAVESIPDIDEAEALVSLLAGTGHQAWLTYTVDGERTCAGQPLAEAFRVAASIPEVIAVGVNCCKPVDVLPAVRIAREVTDLPVVVYPNSGEAWTGEWAGDSAFPPEAAREWVAAGARVVGGCCRVTPEQIAAVAAAV